MNRREALAVSGSGALLGISGCITDLDQRERNNRDGDPDDDDVPGCTQKEEWTADITTGPADPDPDSIASRRDCANAERPEPTGNVCETFELENENGDVEEVHSVGVKPYPDPPMGFDEESLTEYVSEYEDAYQQNKAVSEYGEQAIGAGAERMDEFTRVLDMYDEITVIGITFGAAVTYRTRGRDHVGDDNLEDAAVYGVDETGTVRLHEPYLDREKELEEDPPDPVEDGDLLECLHNTHA